MVRDIGVISTQRADETTGERAGDSRRFVGGAIWLTLGSAVFVFVGALWFTTWRFNVSSRSDARSEATASAELAARTALAPFITDELFSNEPQALDLLESAGSALIQNHGALRIKLWSSDGKVLWSDDERIIGKTFQLEDSELALFDDAGSSSGFSKLDKQENSLDGNLGDEVIEVYYATPVPGHRPVLVECYFSDQLATTKEAEFRRRFLPIIGGGMVLLFLLHLPLVVMLVRRLDRHRRDRSRLLEQAVQSSDAERRRIAGEVHDGVVQELIASAFTLSVLAEKAPADLKPQLGDQATSTRRMIRELRSLLRSIYPADLPSGGWVCGLNDVIVALQDRGVTVDFELGITKLARRDEELILRVAREALRNVASHSAASHVLIELHEERDGRLVLRIVDNGRGFTADEATRQREDGHLGLQLLNDLASDVGGALRIDSEPGSGTVLELDLVSSRS